MKKTLLSVLAFTGIAYMATAQFSVQKVVIEEFTGSWCGYCPDGAYILEDIINTNENAFGVSIHNGDAMTTADGDAVDMFYNSLGYPGGILNRNGGAISRGSWKSTATSMTTGAGVVTVGIDSLSWDAVSREVSVVVSSYFTGPESGDLRFMLWVTESGVTGSGSGYDQTNYYNTTVGSPFYGLGNPIVGYEHDHVLRMMPSGAWGTAGIIPSTVNFGSSSTHTYTFTLPASVDENEVHLVAGVSDYEGTAVTQRKVLNVEEVKLITLTSVDPSAGTDASAMSAYPNPFSDRVSIQFDVNANTQSKIEVVNTHGQHIATLAEGYLAKGMHTLYWAGVSDNGTPVSNGIYFVRLSTEAGQSQMVKVMMQR